MYPQLVSTSKDRFTAEIVVEWKGYITARIGKDPRAVNLYWQLVDPKFSQLELGFESPSGRLVHCSIPLFNGEVEKRNLPRCSNCESGTPFFDLSLWSPDVSERKGNRSRHTEQAGRIRLCKSDDLLSIVIVDTQPFRSVLYADRVQCDFGLSGDLISLGLKGDFPL